MNELEIKEIEAQLAVKRILDRKNGGMELFYELQKYFQEKEDLLQKRENNLWLIVKNLKPEHLEEIKKLVIPEVFESLGL